MKIRFIYLVTVVISFAGCVDRVNIDVGAGASPIVIDGSITDQPGPYRVEISKAIEIDSKLSVKNRIAVQKLTISDDLGVTEELTPIEQGIYLTKANGIRGKVGRAYKVRVELLDGRVYESIPDTLKASSGLESIYFEFKSEVIDDATQYGFDVFFDSKIGTQTDYNYMWKMIGTYQIETNPELYTEPCGESVCPKPRPCSGYILVGGAIEQVAPCECCTCWVKLDQILPTISDNQFVEGGKFNRVKSGSVPLDSWIFMNRVQVEVQQLNLSRRAFAFWKGVVSQKNAGTSLFQPITGRIPNNFVQVSGKAGEVEGIFYAAGVDSKSTFINRLDVPNQGLLKDPDLLFRESCIQFGNATTTKPSDWQ